MKDPLMLRLDGDWLKATDTTLGADNGIGVATAMALLDAPTTEKLPPLECLFTVDEETGMTGAFQLDGSLVTGRTILNLDTSYQLINTGTTLTATLNGLIRSKRKGNHWTSLLGLYSRILSLDTRKPLTT